MKKVLIEAENVNPNAPLLLTLETAAKLLSVSPRTIRRLSQLGELPPLVKLGHSIRISYAAVVAYVNRMQGMAL